MDQIEKHILDLVQSEGKSADKMTSAFKFVGNGSMEDGIKRIAKFFSDSGYSKGERIGIIKGIGGALGSITATYLIYQLVQYIRQQIQKQKELKKEGEEIIKALEKEQEAAQVNESVENETNNIEEMS